MLHNSRLVKNITGYSLVELLVTTIIFSVGMLGFAVLQLESLKKSNESHLKSIASIQAADIIDRMKANPEAINSNYFVDTSNKPGSNHLDCLGGVKDAAYKTWVTGEIIINSPIVISGEQHMGLTQIAARGGRWGGWWSGRGGSSSGGSSSGGSSSGGSSSGSSSSGSLSSMSGTVSSSTTTSNSTTTSSSSSTPSSSTTSGSANSATISCNSQQMAETDLFQWKENLSSLLPGGSGEICKTNDISSANCNALGDIYVITIRWNNIDGTNQQYRVGFTP